MIGSNQKLLMARAGVPPSDPFFSNVSLLLHGDGTDGSTTFTDSSNNNFTITANGDVQIDTSVVKFGTGSMLFDGTGDYLSVADAPALDLTGDFTIEAWVYLDPSTTGSQTLTIKRVSSNASPYLLAIRRPVSDFVFSFSGSTSLGSWNVNGTFSNGSITFPPETWTHLAAVKSGTTVTCYVNGVSDLVITGVGTLVNNTAPLEIGGGAGGFTQFLNGRIDDYRMTKGIARYTSNFTPPDRPFPDQ